MPKTQRNEPYTLPPSMQSVWMTGKEACKELSMSYWTLRRKIGAGLLESSHYNKRVIITKASVRRYLKQWNAR